MLLGLALLGGIAWLTRGFFSSSTAQVLVMFAILAALAVISTPMIHWAAAEVANRKWASEGIRMEAISKKPESKEKSSWEDNYKLCSNRRALDLILADKESYYMLCISSMDSTAAIVYEVRRDVGL
jgi:hypothetical protein